MVDLNTMKKIYTDGSCIGNPGKGGVGFVVYENNKQIDDFNQGYLDTTNNRMELKACIEAIEKYKSDIVIVTDSKYVQKGITEWIKNWKKNGWKNVKKKPIKNDDLWKRLDEINNESIEWEWVRGHVEIEGNEKADFLANQAAVEGPHIEDNR